MAWCPSFLHSAPLAARCLDRHVGNAIRGVVPGPSVDPVHQVLLWLGSTFFFVFLDQNGDLDISSLAESYLSRL